MVKRFRLPSLALMAASLAIPLAACSSEQEDTTEAPPPAPATPLATADLALADGTPAGTASITGGKDGLELKLDAKGLKAGEHGAHVHMVGKCDGPDFKSAGDHWNPADKKHGLDNPEGQHAGDMPNLTVGPDGTGSLTYSLVGAKALALLDEDGTALVIHEGADDQTTDPSGDSGARIACGVFGAS